ncbi:hypothetical protein SCRM01_173c [Synechococcus phage S-CRM01]|nr:hypothetical protein SCRM01_173c [Synechococcus phage S-CRM01]AEC53119.1 hypothetical protein SCRM01_173c [Synechococcus phage S-CRM01]
MSSVGVEPTEKRNFFYLFGFKARGNEFVFQTKGLKGTSCALFKGCREV